MRDGTQMANGRWSMAEMARLYLALRGWRRIGFWSRT